MTINPPIWIKSSYSDNGGNCIEWAPVTTAATGIIPVRDSKNPAGPVLTITPTAWSAFVTGVKTGNLPA